MRLDRPAWTVLALTAACLVAFGATVPLPRIDGQLIGSDGIKYYVYLPSLLIDGDLDFTDEYHFFYRSHPETAAHLIAERTTTGLPANRFGIGPALLWSPFFIAAHLIASLLQILGFDLAADGTGALYQVAVLTGSILYGGVGVWLCFLVAGRVASQTAALAATLLTVLAGNLIYYLTVEPSMSHPLSMFASSAFFYFWVRSRNRRDLRNDARLGALAGLMALIRPQDGLLLLLPIVDRALDARADPPSGSGWQASSLIMTATAILVFLPQLLVWRLLNGSLLLSGYGQEFDHLFHWPFARLLPVLLSAHRGLLTWHPVFLLGLAGLCLLMARSRDQGARRLAALGFAGVAMQWLVVSSWHQWDQGDAFGGRMFIVCTPIFIFGTAALLDVAARRSSWRRILAGAVLLVALNLLLLVHYRAEIIYLKRPITYSDLTVGRFTLP